jgi:hypothetical protein
MRKLSQKTFERYLNAADTSIACGNEDFITLIKNGKERKFPKSYLDQYIKSIKEKYKIN